MTQKKKQLKDLFQSVEKNTPSLERNELQSLLDKKTSGNLPMGPLQTSVINEDRKRGFIKNRVMIMTFIGAFITAMLLLFSNHEANKSSQPIISAEIGKSSIQNTENMVSSRQKDGNTETSPASKLKDTAFHSLKFDPINLSSVTPIPIGSNDLSKIGLMKNEQGEVIMYHADTKVTFPTYDASSSSLHEKDDAAKAFTNLAIHPSYATDSRGNLLMIYKYVKDSNSTTINLNLLDNAERIKQALASNYRPNTVTTQEGGEIDSTTTPWLVKNVKYNFTVGIMTFDTIMTDIFHEHNPMAEPIFQRLATKDSLYKMQFGGEAGLKERFQFPTVKLSLTEKKILDSLNKIENKIPNRKDMLQKQLFYLGNLIKSNYPDTLKLKLEQLRHKIGYEEYILEHQEDQKNLESIGSLVPILVRENSGLKKDPKFDNGLIFWYEPSEELFNAVPQARDRAAVDNTLFHTSDELKNVVLYPNPASLYLFVSYTVTEASKVNISILDLLGRTIAENISSHAVPSGEHKESISLGTIPPGIYLVLIQTDKGKQSMQRLVIEK
ncbi:MAG: T9SS type A sorting domain-containing protein [Candidatus Kapaibacterium sp.]